MTILIACEQGSSEWLQARAGACTASRFSDARARSGGLDERQAKYVAEILAGRSEAEAIKIAGYKAKPSSSSVKRAIDGERVDEPSDTALRYAQLLAIERIAGQPLDATFETWAMRRGRELEPIARALYEERTGIMIEEAGVALTDDYRFGYSTDGAAFGQRGGIEIKCPVASEKVAGVWLDPQPVIAEYLNQIDGGMWINHWQWIDLVVYTPWLESVGKDLFVHRIHRDEARIEALVSDLMEFIHIVNTYESRLRGVEPPPLSEPPPREESPPAAKAAPAKQTTELPESIFG